MSTPPAGIPEADWLSWPPEARAFVLAQQQENDELRSQLTALATELTQLRERIGRSSRDLEDFAERHREVLNQALGLNFKRWPSDATFLYLYRFAEA